MSENNKPDDAIRRYLESTIAFDNLIVQVGRAIGRAHEAIDLSQIEFQRQILRALREGKVRHIDVIPMTAFTIPETTLDLKVSMVLHQEEEGESLTLSAIPLSAKTTGEQDIDVETSTEVHLRFVSVPSAKELPGPSPSSLTAETVREIAEQDTNVIDKIADLTEPFADVGYMTDERLWSVAFLDAQEPKVVVLIDDRDGRIIAIFSKEMSPTKKELATIGPPKLRKIEPKSAKRGDIVTVRGDNFLTLAGQTVLTVDGRPIPPIRQSMRVIAFKVPAWTSRGDIEVKTPLGTTGEVGYNGFMPLPSFYDFEPKRGHFDILRDRGTWFTIYGNNLRINTGIRFTNGVLSQTTKILSEGRMLVEVPKDAGSGPLTLIFGEHEEGLQTSFVVDPRVERLRPRQARSGAEITVTGNSLEKVTQIAIGEIIISHEEFTLHTGSQIAFILPSNAVDGPIALRQEIDKNIYEVRTQDILYIVPKITGFAASATPGQPLTVYGEGLDSDPDMMTLWFAAEIAEGEIPIFTSSEASVTSVSADRTSMTTIVPNDAVCGFVQLISKRVYTEWSADDTSDISAKKATILLPEGLPADVILEERFYSELERWSSEVGTWQIDQGQLASEGTSRLKLTLEGNSGLAGLPNFIVYAEILQAERFGFSLTPSEGTLRPLQVWVDLIDEQPALKWSELVPDGEPELLDGIALEIAPGGNFFVQLKVEKPSIESNSGLLLTLLLDQTIVHQYQWQATSVLDISILSDSSAQRWDNVIIAKRDVLRLPAPENYQFAPVLEPPEPPSVRIDNFEPKQGEEGSQVTLTGIGLDEDARYCIGGVEAEVSEADGLLATILVPEGVRTGSIVVHGRKEHIASTGTEWFIAPPVILSVIPSLAFAGQELVITGINLPTDPEDLEVTLLEAHAEITSTTLTMLKVLAPDVLGTAIVAITYKGFIAEAPSPIEIRRETVLLDFIESADRATWTTAVGKVDFGILGEAGEPTIQYRASEHMEDDEIYSEILFLHPPNPALRALRGVYPTIDIPEGRIELQIDFGMLWSAAPLPEEITKADGVLYEVGFIPSRSTKEMTVLERVTCIHDGSLERYVVDASNIAGQRGRLVISVFPGRTGLRDDSAIVQGTLIQVS